LDSIPRDSVSGLRDLALIAAMFYSFARVSAVLELKVDDYYHNGAHRRLKLHEKGGKEHDMPVHHLLEQILNEYIEAAVVLGYRNNQTAAGVKSHKLDESSYTAPAPDLFD
jgi:site-specific recombinase XerD